MAQENCEVVDAVAIGLDTDDGAFRLPALPPISRPLQSLLNQARAERTREENVSAQLENQFEENTQRIITARQALDERMGALKELLGVLQTVAGDTVGRFDTSLARIEYPDRSGFLVDLVPIHDVLDQILDRAVSVAKKVDLACHLVEDVDLLAFGVVEDVLVVRGPQRHLLGEGVGAITELQDRGFEGGNVDCGLCSREVCCLVAHRCGSWIKTAMVRRVAGFLSSSPA